jgi:hypothetical protein
LPVAGLSAVISCLVFKHEYTDVAFIQCVVDSLQRTERVPPDSNLAETDPKKFAQLLHDKLQHVKDEEDRFERITNSLRSIDVCN